VIVHGVQEKIAQSLSTTILQPYTTELCRFQQNVQKENVYMTKASVWIRQLNILCYSAGKWTIWKQSSRLITFCFHIGIYAIALAVRRRLHGKKNLFIQEPSRPIIRLILLWVIRFFACIQSFQFVCCCQELNFTASKHFQLRKSILAIFSTEESEIPVSLAISHVLLLVSGCHSWLKIKSLTNSMFESVLTERRRPLPGSLSTLLLE